MRKLAAFFLALVVSVLAIGALAAASSGFPCDFVRVARRHAPQCAPVVERQLVSMVKGGVNGS